MKLFSSFFVLSLCAYASAGEFSPTSRLGITCEETFGRSVFNGSLPTVEKCADIEDSYQCNEAYKQKVKEDTDALPKNSFTDHVADLYEKGEGSHALKSDPIVSEMRGACNKWLNAYSACRETTLPNCTILSWVVTKLNKGKPTKTKESVAASPTTPLTCTSYAETWKANAESCSAASTAISMATLARGATGMIGAAKGQKTQAENVEAFNVAQEKGDNTIGFKMQQAQIQTNLETSDSVMASETTTAGALTTILAVSAGVKDLMKECTEDSTVANFCTQIQRDQTLRAVVVPNAEAMNAFVPMAIGEATAKAAAAGITSATYRKQLKILDDKIKNIDEVMAENNQYALASECQFNPSLPQCQNSANFHGWGSNNLNFGEGGYNNAGGNPDLSGGAGDSNLGAGGITSAPNVSGGYPGKRNPDGTEFTASAAKYNSPTGGGAGGGGSGGGGLGGSAPAAQGKDGEERVASGRSGSSDGKAGYIAGRAGSRYLSVAGADKDSKDSFKGLFDKELKRSIASEDVMDFDAEALKGDKDLFARIHDRYLQVSSDKRLLEYQIIN
ncbi:MAG: hypothetical protein KBD63_01430 [Bacteriovoracaceae bacterium]|nr:hypothetical protein [Bacteriovoracaceae bacterium]